MKLFLATNSGTVKTDNIKLLKNCVNSALKNTEFEVFVIFDGNKDILIQDNRLYIKECDKFNRKKIINIKKII